MSAEISQLVHAADPNLPAVETNRAAVLTRVQDVAADATVGLGQRILQLASRRADEVGQAELERVMGEDADTQNDTYTSTVLGRLLRPALPDDAERPDELAAMLPAPATGTASGERSIGDDLVGKASAGNGSSDGGC